MYALDLAIPPSLMRPMYVKRSVLHKLRFHFGRIRVTAGIA